MISLTTSPGRGAIPFPAVATLAASSRASSRQQILYQGDHRFHFIIAHQALLTTVGDNDVMIGQLDRLLAVISLTRITLGIIPALTEYRVPTNQFIMFDNNLVHVETVSAELIIKQPREIALYRKAFDELAKLAIIGNNARALITSALDHRRNELSRNEER